MTGWADECDSSWWLARDAYEKLAKKDPEHELLRYLHPTEDKAQNWEEMKNRFWDKRRGDWDGQPAIIVQTVVLGNYAFAIERVLAGQSPDIEESAAPKIPAVEN